MLKISIITVSYNSAETIEETIVSVINQDYKNIEYIIIDGASNDKTLQIVEKYKNKINILLSERDSGIYDAMNKGINLASGDIIGILNSDDKYVNERILSNICNCFSKDSLIMGLYSDLNYVKENKIIRVWKTGLIDENAICRGKIIPHPTLFLRKQVYNKCGLYSPVYGNAADFEFILRIILKYKINLNYFDSFTVNMKVGGSSNKNYLNIFRQNIEIIKILKKYEVKFSFFYYFILKVFNRLSQVFKRY